MNIIQLIPPDFRVFFRGQLIHSAAAGDAIIKVNSTEGFKIGNFIVVGNLYASDSELVGISDIPSSNQINLTRALRYNHDLDMIVTLSLFDQFNVYYGTSADVSTHLPLNTSDPNIGGMVVNDESRKINSIPISVVRGVTTFVDMNTNNSPDTFYSCTFYNSINYIESNKVPVIASGLDTDITPQYIKDNYLYGLDLTDDDGQPLPDSIYWEGIKSAFSWLEQDLQIDILPRTYNLEAHDFRREEYLQWVFIKLSHFPVKEVTNILGAYYGNDIQFPTDWVRLKERAGIINLVPGESTFAQFLIPTSGGILPILNNQISFIPGFWKISYTTGFNLGEIPYNLKDFICKRACFMPLNILGDLVGGVGIASKSIGIDGLSQSINTTNSPENSGYSARLRLYTAEIKAELPVARKYWRPVSFCAMG